MIKLKIPLDTSSIVEEEVICLQVGDREHSLDNSASYAITTGANLLARGKFISCLQ